MPVETLAPPQEELQTIQQVEVVDHVETEREIWEREAVRDLFSDASEAFGPEVEQEQLATRLMNLNHSVNIMMRTPEQRARMKRNGELPVISTQAGLDEVLTQIAGLVEGNGAILESPRLTSCTHLIAQRLERMVQSGVQLDDEMTIRECSALLAMADAQDEALPNSQSVRHRQPIYKVLENQFLAQLILEDPEDPEGILTPEVHALWHEPDFLEVMSGAVNAAVERVEHKTGHEWSPDTWSDVEVKLAQKIFSSLGFDEFGREKIIDAWTSVSVQREYGLFEATRYSERPTYIKEQFKAMFELERMRKGCAQELFQQYGIRNFGRYDPGVLVEQLDIPEVDKSLSPEIVISASHDHNTALEDVRFTKKRSNFNKPIFYEADNMVEMMREMVRASKRFGPIEKLLVNGHGKASAFRLGGPERINGGIVRKSDVDNTEYATKFFERGVLTENCKILLSSCSVGKPGGIAEAISRMTGLTVIGPDDVMYGLYYDTKDDDYDFKRLKGKKHRLHRRDKFEMRDAAVYSE